MTVKKKVVLDNTPELRRRIKSIRNNVIKIGIFGEDDSFILMIATVHEFGKVIVPKTSKYLTIPVNKKSYGKSAKSFKDLYVLKTDSGELYLVRNKGKDSIEFLYWLAKKVEIPERSFIRGSYDNDKNKIMAFVEKQLNKFLTLKIDEATFWNSIGEYAVSDVKQYITDLKSPPNSSATLAAKSPKSNPLINTGRLRGSIVWKKVRK